MVVGYMQRRGFRASCCFDSDGSIFWGKYTIDGDHVITIWNGTVLISDSGAWDGSERGNGLYGPADAAVWRVGRRGLKESGKHGDGLEVAGFFALAEAVFIGDHMRNPDPGEATATGISVAAAEQLAFVAAEAEQIRAEVEMERASLYQAYFCRREWIIEEALKVADGILSMANADIARIPDLVKLVQDMEHPHSEGLCKALRLLESHAAMSRRQ